MNVNPYLILNGDCEAAFTFYAQATGGELGPMMRFDGMEGCGDIPPEYGQKIMHTHVMFGQTVLMGSDNHPAQPYEGVKGCSVSLSVDSIKEAERIFAALAQGGQVQMPLTTTFFSPKFGMVADKFGVSWMVIVPA